MERYWHLKPQDSVICKCEDGEHRQSDWVGFSDYYQIVKDHNAMLALKALLADSVKAAR